MGNIIVFNREVSLIIYILSFGIAATLLQLSRYRKLRWLKWTSLAIPIFIAGMRYLVGTDFVTYNNIFKRISNTSLLEYVDENGIVEFGNYILIKFINLFGEYRLYLFTIAMIIVVCFYIFLKDHEENIVIGVSFFLFLMLYFTTSFNIMNQFLALGFVVNSFKYIFKGDIKKYILLIFLGSMFHDTAVLIAPVYFLWDYKNSRLKDKKKIIPIIIIFSVIIFNYIEIMKFLGDKIEFFEKYSDYSEVSFRGNNSDLILKIMITSIIIFFRKNLIGNDKKNSLYIVFMILSCIMGVTGYTSPFIKRLGIYLDVTQVILLSGIINAEIRKSNRRLLSYLIIIYAIVIFFISAYMLRQGHLIPYRILI